MIPLESGAGQLRTRQATSWQESQRATGLMMRPRGYKKDSVTGEGEASSNRPALLAAPISGPGARDSRDFGTGMYTATVHYEPVAI